MYKNEEVETSRLMRKCFKAKGTSQNLTPKFASKFQVASVCDSGSRSHLERNDVLLLDMLQSPLNMTKSIRTQRLESNPNLRSSSPQSHNEQRLFRNLKDARRPHIRPQTKSSAKADFIGGEKYDHQGKNAPIRQSVLSRSLKMPKWRFS